MVAQTISLSIMLVAILAGIFLNNRGLRELKADLKADIAELDKKIDRVEASLKEDIARTETKVDRIEADLREFYRATGKAEGRLDTLEKRIA
jgi:septal ring factor EnvC (AmiA/AmiB activator)